MSISMNYSELRDLKIINLLVENNEIYFRSLVNYLKIILLH